MKRFEREAQLLASLDHPNIAAIYGVEAHALVLELVGRSRHHLADSAIVTHGLFLPDGSWRPIRYVDSQTAELLLPAFAEWLEAAGVKPPQRIGVARVAFQS